MRALSSQALETKQAGDQCPVTTVSVIITAAPALQATDEGT